MDRLYKSGAAVGAPASAEAVSGTYPTGGNPGGGVAATKPGAYWYHQITEEIYQAILGAGLVPDKNTLTQLRDAAIILGGQGAWSTSDVKLTYKASADAGWVFMNDGSIGNAASGGTTRANADCLALFTLFWNNVTNTWAPVSGGRGASAAADFAANKNITLPKALGRALARAGAGSGLTSRALGETLGVEVYALAAAEHAIHNHSSSAANNGTLSVGGGTVADFNTPGGTTGNQGSGTAHQNMQPSTFMNVMIKL